MFYKKTNLETLCDTLLKLVDVQDDFFDKAGWMESSPLRRTIDTISDAILEEVTYEVDDDDDDIQEETEINEPPLVVHIKDPGKYAISTTPTPPVTKKRYFKSGKTTLKPAHIQKPIEVIHGKPDDMVTCDNIKDVITPDNIDSFAENLLPDSPEEVIPQPIIGTPSTLPQS